MIGCESPFAAGNAETAEAWLTLPGKCKARAVYRVTLHLDGLAHPELPYSQRAQVEPVRTRREVVLHACGKHWQPPAAALASLRKSAKWTSPQGATIEVLT